MGIPPGVLFVTAPDILEIIFVISKKYLEFLQEFHSILPGLLALYIMMTCEFIRDFLQEFPSRFLLEFFQVLFLKFPMENFSSSSSENLSGVSSAVPAKVPTKISTGIALVNFRKFSF